ncbi:uncharacterized protein LOC113290367 [Papaver somniferum]|uniref:uncharacterized protein LOC113290367 n=1 Tax=Papaver somniferum TaxID=3469 RepID=UPI000E6FC92A|nr:uncharacterized protein LOC113290367 [Papaver somniferum]
MVQQAQTLQDNCEACQGAPVHEESFIVDGEDWRSPYIEYLTEGTLPYDKKAAKKLEKRSRKFFVIDGELFRRCFNQKTLKCVDQASATRIMEVSHDGEHQGKARIFIQIHDVGDVTKLLGAFRNKQKVSTPYYPQGNGQAESTNKSPLRILRRSLYDNKRACHEELPLALMAYRIAKRTSTGSSPYILVYGEDAIIPAEVIIASERILSASGVDLDSRRFRSLDMIDERRDISEHKNKQYRDRQERFYNQHVKERHFEKGELVLDVAPHVQREGSAGKFAPNWEGPFRIRKVGGSGYYKLEHADGTKIKGKRNSKVNGTWLKKFYA